MSSPPLETADSSPSTKPPQAQIKNQTGSSTTLDAAAIAAKLSELKTSSKGLTSLEAKDRLAKDGPNAIQAHEESRWKKLLGYFWGPIPWMIEIAAVISFLRADWPDFLLSRACSFITQPSASGRIIKQPMRWPPSKKAWLSRPLYAATVCGPPSMQLSLCRGML